MTMLESYGMRLKLALFFLGLMVGGCCASGGQEGGTAVVKSDSFPVYSRMSAASPVVKSFKKRDRVIVELEIVGAGQAWCAVREAGEAKSTGYVLCQGLERIAGREEMPGPGAVPDLAPPSSANTPQSRETRPRVSPTPSRLGAPQGKAAAPPSGKQAAGVVFDEMAVFRLRPLVDKGDIAGLKALLAQGADARGWDGANALFAAVGRGDIEATRLLLAAGADPNFEVPGFGRPLDFAERMGNPKAIGVLEAAGAQHSAALQAAQQKAQDPTNPENLWNAACGGDAPEVRRLIAAGANVNARMRPGMKTPLMAAGSCFGHGLGIPEHTETVRVLLAAGADVNAHDWSGDTALYYAANEVSCQPNVVRLLLAAGAQVNYRNRIGKTPLSGSVGVCGELLKKAGAHF